MNNNNERRNGMLTTVHGLRKFYAASRRNTWKAPEIVNDGKHLEVREHFKSGKSCAHLYRLQERGVWVYEKTL